MVRGRGVAPTLWRPKASAERQQGLSEELVDGAFELAHPTDAEGPASASQSQGWRGAFRAYRAQIQEVTSKLQSFGVAGILAYGLLNTIYYSGAFLFVWLYVLPSPGGLGFRASAQRFISVFASVWAGSQVTKLPRAAGALLLAPMVDRGLNFATSKFNFKSRGAAFRAIVYICLLLALLIFLTITSMWA